MAITKLFIDTQNKRLVDSFTSRAAYTLPSFHVGDSNINVELHLLQPSVTGDISNPFDYVSPLGSTYEVAIGDIDRTPEDGTFTLSDPDNTETTSPIDFNSSAAIIQAAMRSGMPTLWGNVVVSGDEGGSWTIDRVTAGAVSSLVGSGVNLSPDSFVAIDDLRIGTDDLSYRARVRLLQQPAAYSLISTPLPSASVTVTNQTLGSGTANAVQRVSINLDTYDGTFTLLSSTLGSNNDETRTSSPIPFNSTADELKAILDSSFGSNNEVSVTEVNSHTWDIEFTGSNVSLRNMSLMLGGAAGLSVPVGVSGLLSLNTATAVGLIGTDPNRVTKFEIQQTTNGSYNTLYQSGVTLVNDLINPSSTGASEIPTPDATYLRLDGNNFDLAVPFDGVNKNFRITSDGNLQLYDIGSSNWRDIFLKNGALTTPATGEA